jgi:hypothetical protein
MQTQMHPISRDRSDTQRDLCAMHVVDNRNVLGSADWLGSISYLESNWAKKTSARLTGQTGCADDDINCKAMLVAR